MQRITLRFGVLAGMVLLAALSRLLPHPYNFTPVGGMALFGAAYFSRRYLAFAVPFLSLWLSDLYLNNVVYASFHEGFSWGGSLWVYGSFGLITLLGFALLQRVTPVRLLAGSLGASILFFLITNFACWLGSSIYPQNVAGLLESYAAGLPFFGNTLAGDLFYSALMFGVFEWAQRRFPAIRTEAAV